MIIRAFLLLALMISFVSVAHSASSVHRQRVTQQLLSLGYPVEESTVAGLLRTIESGRVREGNHATMHYLNLARFGPFDGQTQHDILDFLIRVIETYSRNNVDFAQIIEFFKNIKFIEVRVIEKMELLLAHANLSDSAAVNLAPLIIKFKGEEASENAILKLKAVATRKLLASAQVFAALELTKTSEKDWANQKLIELIQNHQLADLLTRYIAYYANGISLELLTVLLEKPNVDTERVLKIISDENPRLFVAYTTGVSECAQVVEPL